MACQDGDGVQSSSEFLILQQEVPGPGELIINLTAL